MLILAAVSVAVGLAAALVVSVSWLWAIISIAGSCFLAGVLWVLGWLCRRGRQQAQAEQEIISAIERLAGEPRSIRHVERGTAAPQGQVSTVEKVSDTSSADRFEAILAQLRELNDNLTMTDAQRRKKAHDLAERNSQQLKQQSEEAISSGDLAAAEDILADLTRLEPDSPDISALRERIEQARAETKSHDTADAARQVENLMAASDFAGARGVAETLLEKHPDSTAAAEMLARVRREADAFATEQRDQMYRKIEKAASARHWRSALTAAREFLDAWPDSTESGAIRSQLSTIADNARIEEVRSLRDQIRDMITRRRFAEAVELARDVIERFPETAAATELREQMTRLEERAKSELDNNK